MVQKIFQPLVLGKITQMLFHGLPDISWPTLLISTVIKN